jgi:hypothetical protein
VDTPAIPVPIMTISACEGSSGVERWLSSQCGSLSQYEGVGFGTGVIFCGIFKLAGALRWIPLIQSDIVCKDVVQTRSG